LFMDRITDYECKHIEMVPESTVWLPNHAPRRGAAEYVAVSDVPGAIEQLQYQQSTLLAGRGPVLVTPVNSFFPGQINGVNGAGVNGDGWLARGYNPNATAMYANVTLNTARSPVRQNGFMAQQVPQQQGYNVGAAGYGYSGMPLQNVAGKPDQQDHGRRGRAAYR
jgi:hypothetical protein